MSKKQVFLNRLGKHIAQMRKSRGYSQDRLYLEAGFSRATMSRIEHGQVDPQIWTLQRVADTIGIPLRKLVDIDSAK
jgi:DNA-binding XRE family transcriptional regulator